MTFFKCDPDVSEDFFFFPFFLQSLSMDFFFFFLMYSFLGLFVLETPHELQLLHISSLPKKSAMYNMLGLSVASERPTF